MMKKQITLMIMLLTVVFSAVNAQSLKQEKKQKDKTITIFYFHGSRRCVTCLSIEKYTKEILQESFKKELKSGRMIFKSIDFSKSENKQLAQKYKISFSSLLIDFYNQEKGKREVKNLTKLGFRYARRQPEFFKNEIKSNLNLLIQKK